MTTQSPLQIVKAKFKDKAGLVSAVEALAKDDLWNDRRLNSDKGLDSVSNKKLLHLHDVLSQVKKEYGSRAKLIDAVATAQGRTKDADYKKSLERHSTPRLFEYLSVTQKGSARAVSAKAPAKKAPAKKAPAKKAPAKKAPAKK